MADMTPSKTVMLNVPVSMSTAQTLVVQVLNADGTVSSVLYSASVPSDLAATGYVNVGLTLA